MTNVLQLVIFVRKWEREIEQVQVRVCNAINRDANSNFTLHAPNNLGSCAKRLVTTWTMLNIAVIVNTIIVNW